MSHTARVNHPMCPEATTGDSRRPLQMLWDIGLALLREVRARRSLRDLDSLDDSMLHDLGLGRGELEHAVRHGRERYDVMQGLELYRPDHRAARLSSSTEWR
jgi:uncharacterized protein YjiS (DUF1127 family)